MLINRLKVQFKAKPDAVCAVFGVAWSDDRQSGLYSFPSGVMLKQNIRLPLVSMLFTILQHPSKWGPNTPEGVEADNHAVIEALQYTIDLARRKDQLQGVQYRVMDLDDKY